MTTLKQLVKLNKSTAQVNGTTLVTLLIPSGYNMWLAKKDIKAELATASNIKSRQVRTQICKNLNTILTGLPNQTPPNGLVVLSGSINEYV